ncbi:hypothetical protein EYM_03135 [Ignicoccus islandicus DSM 13165]|uniref:Uncharacterized protein n=2 Tax=Ignicoccus islandicus TaxID=54259 RepID=A0A0U2U8K9_9CREN|nr:hypothetical protein EYM_03135 [Ignicoccus islandicus DSM 13165]
MCREGRKGVLCIISRYGATCIQGKCNQFEGSCKIILRKGSFKSPETLLYDTNFSAYDIDRDLINAARLWGVRAVVTLMVYQ